MTNPDDSGPILARLPAPPDVATRRVIEGRLAGHTTSPSWLPRGLFAQLDALADEHARHRRQCVTHLDALDKLNAKYAGEDKKHTEALRQVSRDGADPPKDDRTPADQRAAELAKVKEHLWAAVHVFAPSP